MSIHSGLPWGTLPVHLHVKWKCLCSAHRESPWPCERLQEKWTHPLPRLAKPGDILPDLWPFYFTSSPHCPCYSIKQTSIQTPIKWYSRTPVSHLLGCLTFWIKLLFLVATPSLLIVGLLYSEQTTLGLGYIRLSVTSLYEIDTLIIYYPLSVAFIS